MLRTSAGAADPANETRSRQPQRDSRAQKLLTLPCLGSLTDAGAGGRSRQDALCGGKGGRSETRGVHCSKHTALPHDMRFLVVHGGRRGRDLQQGGTSHGVPPTPYEPFVSGLVRIRGTGAGADRGLAHRELKAPGLVCLGP